MSMKDRTGMSREGSGRVAVFKETGITNCYTLECSYHNSKKITALPPKYNKALNAIEPDGKLTDWNSKLYEGKVNHIYIYIYIVASTIHSRDLSGCRTCK